MIILGINAYHADSAAALLRDGKLVAAVEEERFTRVKHWAGFPAQAIAWCLRQAGVTLADVDHIAVNQNNRAHLAGKLKFVLMQKPAVALLRHRWRNRGARESLPVMLARHFPSQPFRGQLHRVEHHLAHLSSAFHVSPFHDAVAMSIDGFGDFASAAWGVGEGTALAVDGWIGFPHSLGLFYQALTQYLGFAHYGDEYKVMGLAPYGAPRYRDAMRRIVRIDGDGRYRLDQSFFRHHREAIALSWSDGAPAFDDLFTPTLEDLLGPRRSAHEALTARHADLAASVQAIYEEALFALLAAVQRRTGLGNLALAGGCAMNSAANGKIRKMTPFRHLYVAAAAGDAGGAPGAAFAVWHRLGGARAFAMDHAYWGPDGDAGAISRAVDDARFVLADGGCRLHRFNDEEALCRHVAQAIADGKVIGWFQGRAEWGPRALGHRSILADPRRADMKAILNDKIKRRESFRPFAPSVLQEAVGDWFEDDAPVPFMSQVLPVRPDKRAFIPAVCHVDGTGRPQTVSARANPRFHRLIAAFRDLTGVPMLLNTSFNENEPIVNTPGEALDCFLRTRMDGLVLGDLAIDRPVQA
ncbi:MAG: carbamoyltransferase [Rhodopseudomonas sp.]|nr:carbamoyltransferase [Rhodopseudomonas sp.]